jgi:hypothetical protein
VVQALYAQMAAILAQVRLVRPLHTTPREFLSSVPGPARHLVEDITTLFERGRYGGYDPTAEEVDQAHRTIQELAASLRTMR